MHMAQIAEFFLISLHENTDKIAEMLSFDPPHLILGDVEALMIHQAFFAGEQH